MTSFASMSESKYLKKEDLDQNTGNLLHIKSFQRVNVAQEGEDPEYRWTVSFLEQGFKPLVLNAINRSILEKTYGPDTDDCIDQPIVAYVDENVSFGGKVVGGIRLRAPRGKATPAKPVPARARAQGVDEDDIPF